MKIDIVFALNRDQMDVRMGYFHAQNDHSYPFTRYFLLDFGCDAFGEEHHPGQGCVVKIEDVIHFLLRDHERVPFGQRIDVEECKIVFVFSDFVGRYLACDDT